MSSRGKIQHRRKQQGKVVIAGKKESSRKRRRQQANKNSRHFLKYQAFSEVPGFFQTTKLFPNHQAFFKKILVSSVLRLPGKAAW